MSVLCLCDPHGRNRGPGRRQAASEARPIKPQSRVCGRTSLRAVYEPVEVGSGMKPDCRKPPSMGMAAPLT